MNSLERTLTPLSTRAVPPAGLHTMANVCPRGSTARCDPLGCQASTATGVSAASSYRNSAAGSGTVRAATSAPAASNSTTFFFCGWRW